MTSMDNTPDSPAKTPEGYTTQGGNFWTLITPEIWKVLHAVLHPTSIAQKVTVIVEHFREHVMHQLGGQAKAMVVSDSRVAAVRYKKAFDDYIRKMKYTDCKALVAYWARLRTKNPRCSKPKKAT